MIRNKKAEEIAIKYSNVCLTIQNYEKLETNKLNSKERKDLENSLNELESLFKDGKEEIKSKFPKIYQTMSYGVNLIYPSQSHHRKLILS